MTKFNRHLSILALCAVIFMPLGAFAAGNAYVGISAGQGTLKEQGGPDQTSVGWKIFGGLHATGPFAAEVSHVNLGEYCEDATGTHCEVSGNALHLVGKLPFSPRLTALAKVGVFSWDVEYNNSNTSRTGTDTTYGFAVTYILLSGQTLRFEWEHYSDVGKYSTYSGNDMTFASIGISIGF